ncbi:MAG: MarC family protein [Candidatus Aenigmarchaeota archaeon]|nr:MarC family protein [Candidatus Aenigmarchaeota archaeon]
MLPFATDFLSAFILLFVIMDPFASMPFLMKATKGFSKPRQAQAANKSALIAAAVMLVFAFGGVTILNLLSIDIPSFQIAGGIVLAILGLQLVLGFSFASEKKNDYDTSIIVIGTPMITGPGVITTVILFTSSIGLFTTIAAALSALLATWLVLRLSVSLQRVFSSQMVEIVSRILGIILVAMAINFIRTAIFAPVAL